MGWFIHVERMSESRFTSEIYRASVNGIVGDGGPRRIRTLADKISSVLKKGRIKSTRKQRTCMKRLSF